MKKTILHTTATITLLLVFSGSLSAQLPAVTTTGVSYINSTTAVSGGNVTSSGGPSITARGVCWAITANPDIISSSITSDGSGNGTFSSNLTGLQPGMTYHIRAYATNSAGTAYGNEVIYINTAPIDPIIFNPNLTYGTIMDVDGNNYKTIPIGNQVWMAENLKTFKYSDGTAIPQVTDLSLWNNLTTPAYHLCNSEYGALYNWFTVSTGNLCPVGWHIPTDDEFHHLVSFLDPNAVIALEESLVAGDMLKETGTTHWISPNTGASNEYGFTALPGGACGSYCGNQERIGFWWSATELSTTHAMTRSIYGYGNSSSISSINREPALKTSGVSVRCINNFLISTLTTTTVNNILINSATSGGNITDDGGSPVTARGVCWSTSSNPTTSDNHTTNGSGTGSFTSSLIGLTPNMTYYVRAYATNGVGTAYGNEVVFTTLAVSPIIFNPDLTYGTINDIDNNTYKTIRIGTQMWMAENLKTTRLNDGSGIELVINAPPIWTNMTTPGYCWFNNDPISYKDTYGALYNWFSVNTGKLCPTGWHVPTSEEFTTLMNDLGGTSVAGGKLKEIGTTHWTTPNTGATNESGFTALPGGDRYTTFQNFGGYGHWWSSTYLPPHFAYELFLSYFYASGSVSNSSTEIGESVRCINDPPTASINGTTEVCMGVAPPNITFTGTTGTAPFTFTYTINSGSNLTVTTSSGNSVSVPVVTSTAGTYTYSLVSVQDAYSTAAQTGNATVTVIPTNTITLTSSGSTTSQNVCINTAITNITYATTGATGATVTGLPAGVAGVWAANGVTISGTPSAVGSFIYTVTITGGCGVVTTPGTITVTPNNTVNRTSPAGTDAQTVCFGNAITNITYATTGATGATVTGLPAGVAGVWAANVVTISGTPSAVGSFIYTVTITGGCGVVTTPGTITVTPNNTVNRTSPAGTDAQTVCFGNAITNITYATTGATGATVTGLPAGVAGVWAANVVTISGTPTASGPFTYTVTLTGGCGVITTTGTITVTVNNTVNRTSPVGTDAQTLCIGKAITNITYATTGATGATVTGLPAGVTGVWAANVVTISGAPTTAGPFTYTVTLTGGCGFITTTGIITVTPDNTITRTSPVGTDAQTVCIGTAITNITYTTTGATGATFTGMTAGVIGYWAANMITISGVPASAGIFNYTVTLTGSCGIITATGTIIVTALPVATALSNGPLIPGSSLSLIGGPAGMTSYAWTGPNGFISALQSPVVSTSATPDMAGVYTLTVTSSSGCQNSASTLVASNPLIVTNVNDNGIGSLRYAMNYANSTVGTDIITFSIPGYGPFAIQPQTALPAITDPVIIDGYSQPGASATSPLLLIGIDGTYAGSGSNGLTITGGNCTIKGLIINSFSGSGIQITGSGANSILGNYIGVDYSGTVAKGNAGDGIHITGSSNNKIGGANPGDGNVISANNGAGISIIGNSAIGNLISSNSIYSNGGIGIDLGGNGVTSNDTGDPDTGPNNLQNFPVLGPATFSTGSVTITGTLNSKASTTYNLQFFASVLADNSGYGEGQTYLGSKTVTTNSTGDGSFTQAFAIKSSSGTVITATATDPTGNTSEFSKAIGGYQDQKVASSNWPLKYTLNADGVPNITDGSDLNAVRAAFSTWSAISTASISFTDGGTTTSKYANANDHVNLVSFEDDQFPFSYGVLAVAAKTLQVDPVTNVAQIIDADIVVNPAFVNDIKYNLGILDNAKHRGYFDIQSVITHEIGHVLGLLHSSVVGATMFFTMGSGIKVRTLEQDDKSWASYGYPSATYNSTYGSISGNITYGYGGQSVAGAIVYAINTSTQDSVHAYSDAQGSYLVPGLIPGSYYIYIEPLDGDVNGYNLRPGNISPYIYANTVYTDYPGEFYNKPDVADEPNGSKSIVTVVTAGSNTSGINLITNIDKIPPYVVSVTATDVSGSLVNITTNFSIKFSEAVDETSLSNATCYLTAGTNNIGGSFTILGNNVVLFDPESVLDYGTGYTLHITKGVTDLRGNALQPEFTQNFTTIPKDNVPPEINEVIPANGAMGVFVTDKIMVFFSEPMNKSSVEKGFVLSSGGLVISGSFSWDDANTVVTFSPYASLKEAKTVYTITLPGSITDLAGNQLSSTSFSFTTVATAPPTITYLGPANLSTGVPVTTPIVVDFSEPINPYTVTSTTFKLLLGGSTGPTITGQFEFLNENSRVVFTPYANLNFNQIYTISLTAGIKDVSLPTSYSLSPKSSTFTTAATVTVPDILYLDPSNGVAGDKVVITGTGFDPNPVKNVVTFNGLNATVTGATLTSLTAVVPQGALSGPVSVTVNLTASDNTMYFGVIPQSLNPCSNIITSQGTNSTYAHGVGLTDAVSVSGVHTTYAYVTNPDQGTVSVVNLTTPSETPKSITVGDTPMNIAINPQGTKAYVTNFNSHNVSVLDLVSNKVINTITVGIEPYDLTVTPDGKRVYVANYYSENVSMIDEDPNSGGFDHSTVTIATPSSRTTCMTATMDNAMVLITDEFGLKIIDSNPADKDYNSITANVSTGTPANGVTATGDASLAIVSTVDGHLLMINLHPENGDYSDAITANVSTGSNGGGKPSGSGDNMFVYLPDTEHNQVLVYQIGIGTGGSGTANGSGISGLTLIPHNTIPIPTAPVALAISADASRLYVLNTIAGTSSSQITSVAICCGPITPAKAIGDLIIAIQDMINTGAITKLRGYALIISLNSALRNINANRPNLAIVDLTAFNVLVNTYIKNKQITSAQGNALVKSATALINQLKGTKSALAEPALTDTTQVNQDMIPVSKLGVIYPNPFSQSITINYQVAEDKDALTKVQIMIYDINGRLVKTLVDNKMMQQGSYSETWKGTYDDGTHAPYGTYFVLFRAGGVEEVSKIMLFKPR